MVPPGSELSGVLLNAQEPPSGSGLLCDLSVADCVLVSAPTTGSTAQGGQSIHDFTINRASGTIPAGSIAVLNRSFMATGYNINANGHAIGFEFQGVGNYGIVAHWHHLYSCNITDTDVVVDSFPEVAIADGRFGCNGARQAGQHNNYVKITGANGGWPNTVTFGPGTQFNDIQNPTCAFNFTSQSGAYAPQEIRFNGVHLEFTGGTAAAHSVFCSDSTVTKIIDLVMSNSTILDNDGDSAFFSLNAATAMADWRFDNNWVGGFGSATNTAHSYCSPNCGWYLALGTGPLSINASGNIFNNPKVQVVGPGSGTSSAVNFEGNNYYGGLAVSGNFGTAFPTRFSGVLGGGSVSNTATSAVEIDIPGFSFTSCPGSLGVSFNSVAATLSTAICKWQIQGSQISVVFYFQLSALGTGAGAATLTGLPFTVVGGTGGPVSNVLCTNMSSLSNTIMLQPGASSTVAYFAYNSASGYGYLTNSNFTSSSICSGALTYPIQ